MRNIIAIYQDNFFNVDSGDVLIQASINHDAIRKAVLYWDNIVISNTHEVFCDISHAPWVKELRQEKILIEPILTTNPANSLAEMMYNAHMNFIEKMLNKKDLNFSVYNFENGFKKNLGLANSYGGESITLSNALPVPSERTNINDILEFKSKRKDELGMLMAHLNSLELNISEAENKEHALKKSLNDIDIACRDVIRLHKESRINFNLSNTKFNFSVKEITKFAGIAYGTSIKYGFPHTTAVIAGIIAGASTMIEIKEAISFKKIDKSNPFNFVGEMSLKLSGD